MGNSISSNGNPKKAEVALVTPDKMDFRTEYAIKDKGWHCIMIKGQSNKNT